MAKPVIKLLRMSSYFRYLLLSLFIFLFSQTDAQVGSLFGFTPSYSSPKKFEIGGVTVNGADYFDHNALKSIAGLNVGREIDVPGDAITPAIKKLWQQKLFSHVAISIDKIEGKFIYLIIDVQTMPRLSKFSIKGVKKGQVDDLRESIKIVRGKVLTEDVLMETENKVKKYYEEKGYLNVEIKMTQESDTTLKDDVILTIDIKKNKCLNLSSKFMFRWKWNLRESQSALNIS